MTDTIYESLLTQTNGCSLTLGVEEHVKSIKDFDGVVVEVYQSLMTKIDQRRYTLSHGGCIVSGMIVEKTDNLWYVCHLYTSENFRRQGAAKLLFNLTNQDLKGKLRHSELLSEDGQKFVNS